jgi:hypothetical protein
MTWITTLWDLWSWGLLALAVLTIPVLMPVRRHLVARVPSRVVEESPRRTVFDPGEAASLMYTSHKSTKNKDFRQ